ncbi:hypothetical protein CY34DRAFT_19191 [Suillus luteus UH-Slu-Lm8-n1]|uniref:Unplaced genomic scaffold CY34scaffold_1199, whole genome shotgun sequence n=1 Tax=Suillus luteus UH-Slu-Lm8-n1 TaxID=930992 RepID=A0A0C9Z485_9AGAM|nr:hypothetical protein CY34DRAFT_19191 [Suillus luteus UH-Slu-Lm8-n1]
MTEDLPHVRNHIADALTTSTTANSYGPSNICSRLDIEQQLLNTEKSKRGDVALAATGKGGNRCSDHVPCGTCGATSHPTKDCFSKGGAMEGKRDEVMACKCAACKARSTTTSTNKGPASKPMAATCKPGSLRYDTNGHASAYLLDSKSHQAIYVASAPEPTDASTSSTKFTGLASDTITPAFIMNYLTQVKMSTPHFLPLWTPSPLALTGTLIHATWTLPV